MNTSLFDVLHHAADEHGTGLVTHAVHIALDGIGQEVVQQHRESLLTFTASRM